MLIRVQSMSAAMELKQSLAQKNIDAKVVQNRRKQQNKGCGYSVQVEKEHLDTAKAIANALGVKITGVYMDV